MFTIVSSNIWLTFLQLDSTGELLIKYQHSAFGEAHNSALAKAGQTDGSIGYESASAYVPAGRYQCGS